jgi:hypothetical protein
LSSIQRIVVLMSTNYAGSHLLSHLLGAHPQCLGVGEIHRYAQLLNDHADASVITEYANNPVYVGLDRLPESQWHEEIGRRANVDVIVDNSKKVKWLDQIRKNPNYDIKLVHLVRDPRALVARWLNTYTEARQRRTQRLRVAKRMPRHALEVLRGSWETVFLYKWLRENMQVNQFLIDSELSYVRVTYRDLAFSTEETLAMLMPELGLEFEAAQLRFGESDTLGTTKIDHAETVSRSEIKPDLKWQQQLSPEAQGFIEGHSAVTEFLQTLGLKFVSDGLTSTIERRK